MKSYKKVILGLVLLIFSANSLYAKERVYFNPKSGDKFKVLDSDVLITLPENRDVIMIVSVVNLKNHISDNDLFGTTLMVYKYLLQQFKFKSLDRSQVAYGIFDDKNGFVNEQLFSISIADLEKLNSRDFAEKDMSNPKSTLPIRDLLKSLRVINKVNFKKDISATKKFQSYVSQHDFGLVESFVENAHKEVKSTKKSNFRGVSELDCYKIKENGPQQVCLNGTGGTSCYGIKDMALQKVCLDGVSENSCNMIRDYATKKVCLQGVRTDACDSITDYNKKKSCKNFSGSTEFWLIFSSYGYYTW